MDTFTHLALGACTGELILGKKMGKKAMLWGAIVANIPDLDIIPGLFLPGDESLWVHRSLLHSLPFALVFGLCLAVLAKKLYPKIGFGILSFFFCFELALHDLLDTCTSYGTGLFEPFSHQRYSIHLLYVVDPLFTISLLVAAIYLLYGTRNRKRWAVIALLISAFYSCFAGINKAYIDSKVNASMTTPAPFNTLLWFCIQKTNKGFNTGYSSIFDKQPISYAYHPQNDSLLKQPEPYLLKFANGYYTLSQSNGNTYFNILRFGQIQGWANNNAPFTFSYPLNAQGNQNMIIQKGRLTGWNVSSVKQYLERIAGK